MSKRSSLMFALLCSMVMLPTEARSGSTIPRSHGSHFGQAVVSEDDADWDGWEESSRTSTRRLPWNPSPYIDSQGFLAGDYHRMAGDWEAEACIRGRYGPRSSSYQELCDMPVTIRQVPGDGNCLFHALAATLSVAVNRTHVSMNVEDCGLQNLQALSFDLRRQAVACLRSKPRRRLYMQGTEYLKAGELLEATSSQYEVSPEEYCDIMQQPSYWGGGPEIVALCNVLRRPIHVYELCVSRKSDNPATTVSNKDNVPPDHPCQNFRLRRMACFGSPKFDGAEPLHILSADSRFPDVTPGHQLASGNHFLAVFPQNIERVVQRKEARRARKLNAAVIQAGGGGTGGDSRGRAGAAPAGASSRPVPTTWGEKGDEDGKEARTDRVGKRVRGTSSKDRNVEGSRSAEVQTSRERSGPLVAWFSRLSRWWSKL